LALARGVGHIRNISVRFPPLERVPEQARGVGQCVAVTVGKDEEPFASVRRTDFRRRKEARRKSVAHADQSCGDFGKAEAEMMGDVFEKDERGFNFADNARDVGPEVSGVFRPKAFACQRERLARVARREDVHCAAPRPAIEGGNIVPDKCFIQGRVFHPRHEKGRGVGFPFDMAHSSISGQGEGEAEINAPGSGTQREPVKACVCGSGRQACGRYSQVIHSSAVFVFECVESRLCPLKDSLLAGELLPALDGDIDVGRVQLDPVANTPGRLGRDQCGA
jgi:hypothetical protein